LNSILFGSEHPYVSDEGNMTGLKNCGLIQAQMNAILCENAERRVPQLEA
jgi:predicted TIM-barrel fold metal-dependent hydrolase